MSDADPDQASRRPRAFRLTPDRPVAPDPAPVEPENTAPRAFRTGSPRVEVTDQPDPYAAEARDALEREPADEAAVEVAQRSGMRGGGGITWARLFWTGLGGLLSLGVGLWADKLIEDLFARAKGLGWLGVALLALAVLALLALAAREAMGVLRQRHVAKLHGAVADAHAADDGPRARALLTEVAALYAHRPETAEARAALAGFSDEIIDGRDLLDLGERHLMAPLDARARREIALAARRVSVATAVSPRAALDLVFVVAQVVVLVRRIAEIYSGRPGLLGFARLARSVGAHLALTAGMAVGDGLLQGVVGHGIASKLSRRLGEGVLNGLLTTRVGLSAMAVCRPMPFAALKPPSATQVAPFLFGGGNDP